MINLQNPISNCQVAENVGYPASNGTWVSQPFFSRLRSHCRKVEHLQEIDMVYNYTKIAFPRFENVVTHMNSQWFWQHTYDVYKPKPNKSLKCPPMVGHWVWLLTGKPLATESE